MPGKRIMVARVCDQCGTDFLAPATNVKKGYGRFCSLACRNLSYKGRPQPADRKKPNFIRERNPNWHGGSSRHSGGYRAIRQHDGRYRLEHRVVMEAHLGRSLQRHEHVHHINGIKTDNRIENLQVMSAAEHARLHRTINRSS
jgi:hypothetical protein